MSKPKAPSLALDLARQAAAAAKAEVQAAEGPAAAPSAGRWQPAALPDGFLLAPALSHAVHQAASHMARALHHEGLEVTAAPQGLPVNEAGQGAASAVRVTEGGSGRLVRGYSAPALLGLFASQQQRNGVVVDGQV